MRRNGVFAQRLRLIELLHEGAVQSWKALDGEQQCVVKIALATVDRDTVTQRVAAIRKLRYPAFCRDLDILSDDHHLALVRPLVEGKNSSVTTRLGWSEILRQAIRLAEALHVAHASDVVHGNLKPENIIVGSGGEITIVDFFVGEICGVRDDKHDVASTPESAAVLRPSDDMHGFGALLAYWVTGVAPGAAMAEEERIHWLERHARADLQLPSRCASLIASLLSADSALRPEHMLALRDALDDLRLAIQRTGAAGLVEMELSQGAMPKRAMGLDPVDVTARRPSYLVTRIVVALVLIAGLVGTMIFLSRQAPSLPNVAPESPQPTAVAPLLEAPEPPGPEELERLLAQRESAEATLDEIINLQLELTDRQVERWATDDFAAAKSLIRSADAPFRAQDFAGADAIYAEALYLLKRIAAHGASVLAEALERGVLALQRGDAIAAADAFSLALAINPDDSLARLGLQRSETLDEVLALLQQARLADEAQDDQTALTLYRRIVALDAETRGAAEAIPRLETRLAESRFRTAMSEGLAALEASRWEVAKAAFRRAQELKPAERGPADGLVEVARRFREAQIKSHYAKAQQLERREEWAQALSEHEMVLRLDANLRYAQDGRERARVRAELDARLRQMVAEPQSWWSDDGRQTVAQALHEARTISAPGPRLVEQVATLERQLNLARQPVAVQLLSDNACNVVVYKVAHLGAFEIVELQLRPGRYTVVGTRDGYRDVRKDFLVPAGQTPQPVVLRCEEQV